MTSFLPLPAHEYGLLCLCDAGDDFGERPRKETHDLESLSLLRLRNCLCRLSARRVENLDDAEDLVQETLLTMSQKRSATQLQKGLAPWCFGILRRKVGNYYRKAKQSAGVNAGWIDSCLLPDRGSAGASAEGRLHYEDLRRLIANVISELPPAERQPLLLLMAGRRVAEVAKEMRPEKYQTVVGRIYRGRKKIARGLELQGYRVPVRVSRSSSAAATDRRSASNRS